MIKSQLIIPVLIIAALFSGCIAQMEVFDQEADDAGIPHIGNFYSTSVYQEQMSDEVWVTPAPDCISIEVSIRSGVFRRDGTSSCLGQGSYGLSLDRYRLRWMDGVERIWARSMIEPPSDSELKLRASP